MTIEELKAVIEQQAADAHAMFLVAWSGHPLKANMHSDYFRGRADVLGELAELLEKDG